jgi:hypothetical protein
MGETQEGPAVRKQRQIEKCTPTDAETEGEHLRDLLRKRLADVLKGAAGKSGEIPADHLSSIERLSKAIKLADELKPPPRRWTPVLGLLAALLLVSSLMVIRVSETEVTLELAVTDLSFGLSAEKPVLGSARVAQIGVSGLDDLKISPEVIPQFRARPSDISAVKIASTSNSILGGAISRAALIPPPGTKVWLSNARSPQSYPSARG